MPKISSTSKLGPKKLVELSDSPLTPVVIRVAIYINTSIIVMKKMNEMIVKVGQNVNLSISKNDSCLGFTNC